MSDSKRTKSRLVADRRYGAKPAPPKRKPRKKTKRRTAARPKGVFGWLWFAIRWVLRLVWRTSVRITAVALIILAGGVLYYWATLPEVGDLFDGRARGSVTLTDREGDVFAWRGDQFGGVVHVGQVSPHLKNAVVATEDKRFYRHIGVSPRGIASAVRINLREGRGPLSGHGGSTITQQTAKLLCMGQPFDPNVWESERAYESECRSGSLWRKVREATYALAMEAKYSKDDILSIYLNRAFLGAGSRGFEAASQRYFGKSAREVNAAESAMLAGLLVAPSRYAPTNNIDRSRRRAATVLRLMEEQGYLSAAEREVATNNPAQLSPAAQRRAGAYFADWVMSEGPEFFTRNTTEDVVILTTLDQRLQRAAEEAVQVVFETKVREGSLAQAAVIVMSADGAVRAMVGGRGAQVPGGFNRATQAKRQTGSAFKPFVYATALELGYSPNDTVNDAPYCLNIPGSGEWCPKNYTNEYYGNVTLTHEFKDSLNIPAVKISESVGRDLVQRVARDFGIESALADSPAMALGASEATLLEMVGAYAGILNGGSSVTPYGLVELRLQGDDAPLMDTTGGIGERVINETAAGELMYMMSKVVTEGSGRRAAVPDRQAAGKTGTTQAARDAWFIGFTADYVAGVWMGYDDNTPLSGVTGGGLPAEIWRATMIRVHEGLPSRPLPMSTPAASQVPTPAPQPQGDKPRDTDLGEQIESIAEGIVNQLLRDLFGNR